MPKLTKTGVITFVAVCHAAPGADSVTESITVSTPSVIAYGGTTQSVSAMRDYLTPHYIPASERASLLSERQEAEAKLAALRELAEN